MYQGILPNGIFPRDVLMYWDGGTSDRFKKTALTYTSTTAGVRKHRATSTVFNGSTSLIDYGSEVAGAGNLTVLGWINATSYGELTFGAILNNGRLAFGVFEASACLYAQSDGATSILSGTNSILAGTEYFVGFTRTAAGVVNFYVNGVLSGTANQDSGTPAAGVTNLYIGSDASASLVFDGNITGLRIFSKILTTSQIGQIYNKER